MLFVTLPLKIFLHLMFFHVENQLVYSKAIVQKRNDNIYLTTSYICESCVHRISWLNVASLLALRFCFCLNNWQMFVSLSVLLFCRMITLWDLCSCLRMWYKTSTGLAKVIHRQEAKQRRLIFFSKVYSCCVQEGEWEKATPSCALHITMEICSFL